jgi:hypothetical protein
MGVSRFGLKEEDKRVLRGIIRSAGAALCFRYGEKIDFSDKP